MSYPIAFIQQPAKKRSRMAKPNYSYEKRQRELAKKKKKEEKRQQKLSAKEGVVEQPEELEPPASSDTPE